MGMDGIVEENGTSGGAGVPDQLTSAGSSTTAAAHVVATSIVQLTLPAQAPSAQVFVLISLLPIRDLIVDVKCVCATVKKKFIIGIISLCSDEFCCFT